MLRKIRITLALIIFIAVTLLFLDFTGLLHSWLGWSAKIQFLPALLALNIVVVVVLTIITLVFGRIYCSIICPLGVMQDIISWLHRKTNKKDHHTLKPALNNVRWAVFAIFVIALVFGIPSLVSILAPYSSYGRIAHNLMQPLYILANNGLAALTEHLGGYTFYTKEIWVRSTTTFIVAAITMIVIALLAWHRGREYCNSICPIGTILSVLARFSWFKIHFVEDKCIECSLCSKNCKANCIDYQKHTVDHSRCITCGTCLTKCNKSALVYAHTKKTFTNKSNTPNNNENSHNDKDNNQHNNENNHNSSHIDNNRRAFLIGSALLTGSVIMAQKKKTLDQALVIAQHKPQPIRRNPITPPGSKSSSHLANHCTACQLCIAQCPNKVLRPSASLDNFMQPTMSYTKGYCNPKCTRCSSVCPTGAILPITRNVKKTLQIGYAVWRQNDCIVLTHGAPCGQCAAHCPTGAISMEPMESLWDGESDNIPVVPIVHTKRCIGCGACEYVCPATPSPAIYVEGHKQHRTI